MARASTSEGFTGMAALIRDLEQMGEAVQADAAEIVRRNAEFMAQDVQRAYPVVDADLVNSVVVEENARGQFTGVGRNYRSGFSGTLRWKVRAKAPHAHLFEFGTVQRSTNSTGANRGTMPAKPTFIPAAVRRRAQMERELVALVQRQRVKGMDGTMEVRER